MSEHRIAALERAIEVLKDAITNSNKFAQDQEDTIAALRQTLKQERKSTYGLSEAFKDLEAKYKELEAELKEWGSGDYSKMFKLTTENKKLRALMEKADDLIIMEIHYDAKSSADEGRLEWLEAKKEAGIK